MDIANNISENETLLRLGLHFDTLGPRVKVQETLKNNWDNCKKRKLFYQILSFLIFFFSFLVRKKRVNK
jgi:hypothetical protein